MHALLGAQGSWEIVQEGLEEEAPTANLIANQLNVIKEMQMKDKTALYLMFQDVDELGFEKLQVQKHRRNHGTFWRKLSRVLIELNKYDSKIFEANWKS